MAYYKSLKNAYRYSPGQNMPGQSGWISQRLLRLRAMLDETIRTPRKSNSLIIGSWNIRHFDGGRPRMPESFHFIAEIIDHFDICAVQEVKDIAAVKRLMGLLGPNWDFFINDSSGGGRGNHERMAFLYNKNKVRFRNLIGELVVSADDLPGGEQLARTPFFASFQAGWFRFTLCSAHIVFREEDNRPLREHEIDVIAKILAGRAKDMDEVHIFLGDMNVDNREHPGFKALERNGFNIPDIGPTSMGGDKYYDQIAFSHDDKKTEILGQGVIRYHDQIFTDNEAESYRPFGEAMRRGQKSNEEFWDFHRLVNRAVMAGEQIGKPYSNWTREYPKWRTHEMSDHFPIWIELKTDYSDLYLDTIK